MARRAAEQAGLFTALGHAPGELAFVRLAETGATPLPVKDLFDEAGELVQPPVPFRFDATKWQPYEGVVGGAVAERLSTLSRAAAYLAPGAPLEPAPDAPFALAVSNDAVQVNPRYLGALPPSPVVAQAAPLEVPPMPDASLSACVQRLVDRCRACLTSGGCNTILASSSSGADECAALAANQARGLRLLCAGGLYARAKACLQADGAAPCAPVDNPALQGLESFAPLVDNPVCAGAIDRCLNTSTGGGGESCGSGGCGDAPRCRNACGDGCALSGGPLDVACALPCEITGGVARGFGWRPDKKEEPETPGGHDSEVCGGCSSDKGSPGGVGGSGGGGGAGGTMGTGGSGAGGAGGTGTGGRGTGGSTGTGGTGSGGSSCGNDKNDSSSSSCNSCDSCNGCGSGSSGKCSVAPSLRSSRYGSAEPLLAILLPLFALAAVRRRVG